MQGAPAITDRWQLYRILAEPVRLRLLALAAAEELGVGELAELLGEGQPNVSRHASALRQAGLLAERRQGTRVYLHVPGAETVDAVIADALATGRRLIEADGSLARVEEVVRGRDRDAQEFFARHPAGPEPAALAPALPAYLFALCPALAPALGASAASGSGLAIDAGTGDGALIDVLAPLFAEVVAVDRSEAQIARAAARVAVRGYRNVTLFCAEIGAPEVASRAGAGALLVVSTRMLHHAPRPAEALAALGSLACPGGHVVVIDYLRHDDERFGEQQADLWLGFEAAELLRLAAGAGLEDAECRRIPSGLVGTGIDAHLPWQVLAARRGAAGGRDERAARTPRCHPKQAKRGPSHE